MKAFGTGIFMWTGPERRSQRYGYFYTDRADYANSVKVTLPSYVPFLSQEVLHPLVGKRVRISVTVIEARDSGHAGDRAINIFPSRPVEGSTIELGVGILDLEPNGHSPAGFTVGLIPGDGRTTYWIDPHILYQLHDQTVSLSIEATDDEFSPLPQVHRVVETGVIDNGDGSFQAVGDVEGGVSVLPKIELHEEYDDLRIVKFPGQGEAGEVFEVVPRRKGKVH